MESVEPTIKKTRKKKRSREEVDLKETKKQKQSIAEALTFKKIQVDMVVMGAIKEITAMDMVVSLPNQLTGFVSITEISSFLTSQLEKMTQDAEASDEESGKEVNTHYKHTTVSNIIILYNNIIDNSRRTSFLD